MLYNFTVKAIHIGWLFLCHAYYKHVSTITWAYVKL